MKDISYYTNVENAWKVIYKDCENANKIIRFEQFILKDFDSGEIGKKFVNLFCKKAKEGVKVRILLDVWGSISMLWSPIKKELIESGVVLKFVPPEFKSIRDFFDITPRRNHRKLIIIDEEIAYIGGVVFTKRVKDWNDFHVRITEPSKMFSKAFEMMLNLNPVKEPLQVQDLKPERISLIANEYRHRILYKEICHKISKSKKSIHIITPYFSPDRKLRKIIRDAASRGVEVKIVIPQKTDHTTAQWAHISYISYAKKSNVKISAQPKMNHSKIIRIDDWLTFGSANFDRLSMKYNKELNVETTDSEIVRDVTAIMESFTKESTDFGDYTKKELSSLLYKLYSSIGYLLRSFV